MTGLYRLSSRYYDPEIGRFISPDSVDYLDPTSINGLNLYAYCNNDSVNRGDPTGHMAVICAVLLLDAIGLVANVAGQALTDLAYGNEFKIENYLVAAGTGFIGGMCYAIPGYGGIISAFVTSGLTTAGQMALSNEKYDVVDYLIMVGGSAALSALTSAVFGGYGKKPGISDRIPFFKDSNFIFNNFLDFATSKHGITLNPIVLIQAAGKIAIRETIAGFVGSPLSGIPRYFDEVYNLCKLGLSIGDSFKYAF